MNLYGYADGDPINNSDPSGLCPIEKDGIPCFVVMGAASAGAGMVIGATYGAAGGTLVAPGVGTVGGALGGAVVVGGAGMLAGVTVGAARDAVSVVESVNWGRLIRTIGLLGGLLGGDAGQDLSKRLLDIEKARAAAARQAAEAEKERKRREEERKRGDGSPPSGQGGDGGTPPPTPPQDGDTLLTEVEPWSTIPWRR